MQVIPLSEGAFTIDKSKQFVPFNLGKDDIKSRPGSLLVEVQPFAVVTSRDVIVIDAGLGFYVDGQLQLHQNLRANGIEPDSVTKVLMSHLHKDHAGGISVKDQYGDYALSFSKAKYFVQRQELEYAMQKVSSSYIPAVLSVLEDNAAVTIIDGTGVIDEYIRYEISGGHCPYHQVFWIEDEGEIVFFGGDVAPQLQQMKSRLVAKYDMDGKLSMELRQQWWETGQQQKWKFLFYHDIKNPVWPSQ